MPLIEHRSIPFADWQFWLVTLIALVALWLMLRPLLPPRLGGKRGRGKRTRATLTIGGRGPN